MLSRTYPDRNRSTYMIQCCVTGLACRRNPGIRKASTPDYLIYTWDPCQQNVNHASKPTKNHLLPTLAATLNEQSLLNCVENFKDTLRTFVTAHYCLAIGSFLSEQSQAQHDKSGPAYSIDDSLRLHGHKTSCNRTEPMYTQHQSDIPCDL